MFWSWKGLKETEGAAQGKLDKTCRKRHALCSDEHQDDLEKAFM